MAEEALSAVHAGVHLDGKKQAFQEVWLVQLQRPFSGKEYTVLLQRTGGVWSPATTLGNCQSPAPGYLIPSSGIQGYLHSQAHRNITKKILFLFFKLLFVYWLLSQI